MQIHDLDYKFNKLLKTYINYTDNASNLFIVGQFIEYEEQGKFEKLHCVNELNNVIKETIG